MGYPGWHLECSVMSMKYLGKTIDIHGGGLENQFPHHDCEIAQSEAANGVQFVRYWLHNNMVTVDGQKMGKSLNNFITLKQAFSGAHERLTRGYDPLAIRQLILSSHYRSPLDFSDAALFAAQSGFEKITEAVKAVRKAVSQASEGELDEKVADELTELTERFQVAMNDDLNTSVALSVVFDLVRLANKLLEDGKANAGTLSAVEKLFGELGGDVLGVVKESYPEDKVTTAELQKLVDNLVEGRNDARAKEDFKTADAIRTIAVNSGIVVMDNPDGTTAWKLMK
jgi:cysteinyl-tRNA synthetase